MTICRAMPLTGLRSVGNRPIRPLSGVFSSVEEVVEASSRRQTPNIHDKQPNRIRILTANLHLFGDLALLADREEPTPLYFRDHERLKEIIAFLKGTEADVLAFTEVWDPLFSHEISIHLKEIYPYRRGSPWECGVSGIIKAIGDRIPFLGKALIEDPDKVVKYLAQRHYGTKRSLIYGALRLFLSEDQAMTAMQSLLDLPNFWGAGLCLLSKYPISDSQFFPHEERADLDNYTGKGILKSTLDIPRMGPVTVLLTHLQEGNSSEAQNARAAQVVRLSELTRQSASPVIVTGDLNIRAENYHPQARRFLRTDEYKWMKYQLGLRDSYRQAHRFASEHPGFTYYHGPYAEKLGIADLKGEEEMRIDYVLHSRDLVTVASKVLLDQFLSSNGGHRLSDHVPLLSELALLRSAMEMAL